MKTFQEQYVLRVRKNGELDRVLRLLETTPGRDISFEEMAEVGGKQRAGWMFGYLNANFDNMRVQYSRQTKNGKPKATRFSYTDINPGAPISVSADMQAIATDVIMSGIAPDVDISNIRWPMAPPLIESLGNKFVDPVWFDVMWQMVQLGRHIALAGPPGVGKDTAVQELAAREGKVLVTIGGDAGFRRRDLVGQMQIAQGHSYFDVAEYAAAVTNGWWALLTEVNAADADALIFINTQLAPPYIVNIAGKSYPVHPDFRLFVTYNPGLIGTKPLPPSFKDRFFSIQVPFLTVAQMKKRLIANGAPADIEWVNEIVELGQAVWDAHLRGQIRYQVTSRRLMDACVLLMNGIVSSVSEAIDSAVIASIDSELEAKTVRQILNTHPALRR